MKTRKLTLGIALVAIAGSILFSSCRKKEKEEEKDTDTSAASDQSLASSISNDMVSISDEAATTSSVSSYKLSETDGILATSCATVTSVVSGSTKTITVNFGTTNCLCKDNRYRRGSLTMTMSGEYMTQGTVINVTPNSYFVNDNQVTGSKTITNNGLNSSNNLVFSISANIQVIKANGAGTISWQSTRQREWTAGNGTPVWSDDVYSITGSASGSNSNGGSFTSNITTALIRKMSCPRHFVSGVIEHTPSGKATRIINYGSGACDNDATVKINGITYNITLP